MRNASIICWLVIALSSCTEPAPEERVYSEKDIEGYWATNNAIHGTYWLDSLSVAEGAISNHFLRLYNDVCGIADTTYRVSHDTVFVINFDYLTAEISFVPKYVIVFSSADRLILRELKTNLEIAYYSLYEVPKSTDHVDTVKCYPAKGGLGIEFREDSLTFYFVPWDEDGDFCTTEYIPRVDAKVDARTFRRVDELYSRITSEDVLFARSRATQTLTIDGVNMQVVPMSYTLELRGDRGMEIIGSAAYISNPFIRAIYWEIAALESHEIREYKLRTKSE